MARSQPACPRRAHRRVQLGLDVLVHLVELQGRGRIVLEEDFAQPDGAQRLGKGVLQDAVFGADDLRAAAADIDHQGALAGLRPGAFHAQVDEAGFFPAGDDFHRGAGRFRGARQKFVRIARIANRAGGHGAHAHHVQLAIEGGHARQHGAGGAQGLFAHRAGAKDAFAQSRDFAFRRQHARRLSGNSLRPLPCGSSCCRYRWRRNGALLFMLIDGRAFACP